MKRLFCSLAATVSLLGAAEDLSTFLEAAASGDLAASYGAQARSAEQAYRSLRSSYLPRIDAGANATWLDKTGDIDVKESYTAYAKASVTLFDGFRRERRLDEKAALAQAGTADYDAFRKELSLRVVQTYFEAMGLHADLDAQQQRHRRLAEELGRQQRFFEAGLATREELERFRAALAASDYEIASLGYRVAEQEALLFNLTGIRPTRLLPSRFEPPRDVRTAEPDSVLAMRRRAEALDASAQQSTAAYYPSLELEDSYAFYRYEGEPAAFPIERADRQNRLVLRLSMTLFDFASASRQKEAVLSQKLSLDRQIAYESRRAGSELDLAQRAIEQAQVQIRAAERAFEAAVQTLDAVEKKYRARIVDYVAYLDALHAHTEAASRRERALNALQTAYATYYYHAGYDPKEYLR